MSGTLETIEQAEGYFEKLYNIACGIRNHLGAPTRGLNEIKDRGPATPTTPDILMRLGRLRTNQLEWLNKMERVLDDISASI